MSIIVVCPGCRKSFKVSDKFAGKSGPCPGCKKTLRVPTKDEQVKVHAPEEFEGGGRSTSGKLVIKPIARTDAKARPVAIALIVVAVALVFLAAWLAGHSKLFDGPSGMIVLAAGLLLVSPPVVIAAYRVLHDDELEPFRGRSLYIRAAVCSAGYAALWGIFSLVASPSMGLVSQDIWNWLFVLPPFVLAGGSIAFASLNLEFGNAAIHYGFYIVVTVLLRSAAGLPWPWNVT